MNFAPIQQFVQNEIARADREIDREIVSLNVELASIAQQRVAIDREQELIKQTLAALDRQDQALLQLQFSLGWLFATLVIAIITLSVVAALVTHYPRQARVTVWMGFFLGIAAGPVSYVYHYVSPMLALSAGCAAMAVVCVVGLLFMPARMTPRKTPRPKVVIG